MKKTKTGLQIETKGNRIEVYTPKELQELNDLIEENKKRNFNILIAFLIFVAFVSGYIYGAR
jgi:hypothetical protein